MPRSKHGTALFDLLAEDGDKISSARKLHGHWPSEQRPPKRASTPSAEVSSGEVLRIADPPEMVGDKDARFLVLEGERVRVSFTSKTAAVAFFVAVVLLVGVFETGRRSGYNAGLGAGYQKGRASYAAQAISEIEAARSQPPATHLVSELVETAEVGPARVETVVDEKRGELGQPQWIRGYTYIVAQEFSPPGTAAAAKAQEFLAEHGIATASVRYDSGSIQLITTQGYNHKDPTQKRMANELLRKLHAVGAKYYAAGGGYRLDGYFKTFKGDRW